MKKPGNIFPKSFFAVDAIDGPDEGGLVPVHGAGDMGFVGAIRDFEQFNGFHQKLLGFVCQFLNVLKKGNPTLGQNVECKLKACLDFRNLNLGNTYLEIA